MGRGIKLLAKIRCWFKPAHGPYQKHPMGGFVCECGAVANSLDDLGYDGDGYVSPLRTTFKRKNTEVTRTSHWDEERKN